MRHRQGFTLVEIIVILVLIGIFAAISFPNYTTPTEQARAANAQNNLLAVYSAQQNYRNNNGTYAALADLASINSTLALNIEDDGTYSYSCSLGPPSVCTASRNNSGSNLVITMTLNAPIQLQGEVNPACSTNTGFSNWCP